MGFRMVALMAVSKEMLGKIFDKLDNKVDK